jgi:hypothetical protein
MKLKNTHHIFKAKENASYLLPVTQGKHRIITKSTIRSSD